MILALEIAAWVTGVAGAGMLIAGIVGVVAQRYRDGGDE